MGDRRFIVDAFSEMAAHYEQVVDRELQLFWGWSYNGFVDHLLSLAPIEKNDRVLDVASGTAVIPLKLAASGHMGRITGLDLTYAMLARGQRKIAAQAAGDRIRLVCGNALDMPFGDNQFDWILCGLATHHLDVQLLLAEMHRLLRPGGRLAIADVGGSAAWRKPPVSQLIRTLTFLYFWPKEGYARARAEAAALSHVLTPSEWAGILAGCRFEQISVEPLAKKHRLAPSPLVIRAAKPILEESHEHRD